MKIKLTSIFVNDQDKELKFYTETLGFAKKTEMPAGKFKWMTVVPTEGPQDLELLLEPNDDPAARTYQEAIYKQGISATVFEVQDIYEEFKRLKKMGVTFSMEPTVMGPVSVVVFDDGCGNLI